MASKCSRMYKQCFIFLLLVLLYQTDAKPKGGRRTGSSGGSKYGTGNRHSQTQHNTGGGSHYNTGSNTGYHDTHRQSNTYNTGNSNPVVPSAPVGSGTHSIGFEHFNNQHGSSGSQNPHRDIGFDRVNQQNTNQQNTNQHSVGFNANQHNRGSGSTHRNTSSGGYYGGTSHNTNTHHGYNNSYGGNHQQSNIPLNAGHPPQGSYPGGNNYYNQGGHYGGHQQYPQSPYITQNPPGGYYNPNLAQPGGYYHQYHSAPNAPPPQIYQPYPVQQSSGGSALGYVGSLAGGLAGGYLIGRLTSGGSGGGGSGTGPGQTTITNNNYEVHHYYNNGNEVPKQLSVSNSSLATCAQNATEGLCVPNTFPICLFNGTIMCVTHTVYTTPCVGLNTSAACVLSLLPACGNGDPKCNGTGNTNTTAVYIPCLSNVTLTNPGSGNVVAPSSGSTGQIVGDRVEMCVTAIAAPKFIPPPVGYQPPPNGNQPPYMGNQPPYMGNQPPYMGNQPQIQSAGQPPMTKGAGSRLTSGWVFGLMIVLWVGIK